MAKLSSPRGALVRGRCQRVANASLFTMNVQIHFRDPVVFRKRLKGALALWLPIACFVAAAIRLSFAALPSCRAEPSRLMREDCWRRFRRCTRLRISYCEEPLRRLRTWPDH